RSIVCQNIWKAKTGHRGKRKRSKETDMCPACIANMTLMAIGATSSGGAAAFVFRKFSRNSKPTKTENNSNEDQRSRKEKQTDETFHRVTEAVGSCAPETAREGEKADPRPGRAGRRPSPHAVDAGGENVRVRGAQRQGHIARPFRRTPSTDPLPRFLRTGRSWMAGTCVRGLLDGRGPGRSSCSPQCPRYNPCVCVSSAAGRYRPLEIANGLGVHSVVHDD